MSALKLLRAEIADFQKVEIVEFQPASEGATLLAGRNEQGKSSTIQAIVSALSGAEELPKEAVRKGADRSKVRLELGDETLELVVTQEVTNKDDGSQDRKLVVRDGSGEKVSTPQKVLTALWNAVASDPLEFARADPKEQDRVLKELAGITKPWAEAEAKRKVIYDKRTGINTLAERAKARAAGMPYHPKAPAAEVSVAELSKQLTTHQAHLHARSAAEEAVTQQERDVDSANAEVTRCKEALAEAEKKLASATLALATKREAFFSLAPAQDTAELQKQIETAEATNELVRANKARRDEEKQAEEYAAQSAKLTAEIEEIDAQKQDLLAAAKFPVEGLGFNDLGPTLHGVPLAQASTARKLDLSYAVAVALKPRLKLMVIREGAFFDEESLAAIDARARQDGVQVLIERVGKRDTGSHVVIIENGLVQQAATAAE